MKKIICVVGTRPEAIKMAPVINELNSRKDFICKVLATAQHRDMLDQVLKLFEIEPDIDLNIMKPNQNLTELTARLLIETDIVIEKERPDIVLVQGDTTTVMAISLACFYHNIAIGHVEAGLRTWDIRSPFPEEMNRVFTGKLARWHFAPTLNSRLNLIKEGVDDANIFVTGNTVIDSLLGVINLSSKLNLDNTSKRTILVTAHRRENFGQPIKSICQALLHIVETNDDVEIVFPVHPNPNIQKVVNSLLKDHLAINLCKPLDYLPFISVMKNSYLILSDSGGVQEEAPAIGIPVLVLRDETERPEAVESGAVKLIGTNCSNIINEVQYLLDNEIEYNRMSQSISPYGRGDAAKKIVDILESS